MARKKIKTIGEIRQSQALRTFGIGSVVDFRHHSAMPLGLEEWPGKKNCRTIHEPDLERILEKKWFQAPPVPDENRALPVPLKATRFPQWLFCPKCKALGMVRDIDADSSEQVEGTELVYGALFAFSSTNGGEPKCTRRKGSHTCRGTGVPTRLVTVCCPPPGKEEWHPGHIDDFPWYGWAHQDVSAKGEKDSGSEERERHSLKLVSRSRTLAIEDLTVVCSCKARKSLRGIFSNKAMQQFPCKGWRPWLEARKDARSCGRSVKTFLRGATNLHLPVTAAVISIPPFSDSLNELVDQYIDNFVRSWDHYCMDRAEEDLPPPQKRKFIGRELSRIREEGFDREGDFSDEDVIECLVLRLPGPDGAEDADADTEAVASRVDRKLRRFSECEALRKGDDNPRGNFDAVPVSVPSQWKKFIGNLVKVRKLRKVEALLGFRRDSQGNPDSAEVHEVYAPVSLQPNIAWLPAIEMKGEGLFIELNLEEVGKWEKRKEVTERMKVLKARFEREAEKEGWEDAQCPTARYILVHTFSHLLIRQLTLECGYSSASLQERLYVATPEEVAEKEGPLEEMAGCLIYTATADSDGSYGGLVRMGDPHRFGKLMQEGIRIATWCSSDPICSTVEGQGYKAFNRAACHACALLPETSCERRNTFLDRVLAVAPRGFSEDVSFFRKEEFFGSEKMENIDVD